MRIITAAFLTLLFCAVSQRISAASDRIAAVVNSEIITFSQVRALSAREVERLRQTQKEEDLRGAIKVVREACLSRLIDRQILIQEFRRRGSVPLPRGATDEQVKSIIRNHFHGDRPEWLNQLRSKAYIRTYGTLLEDIPHRPLHVATVDARNRHA
jgi:hypothetical protein